MAASRFSPIDPSAGPVAVTGATGFVGRYLVAELTARGYAVRALVRDTDKAAAVLPVAGVTLVKGDALDAAVLAELVEGCSTAAHLIGIRRERGGFTFERAHEGTTRVAVDAAQAAGVRRFLHLSALGVGPLGPTAYQRTKFAAEQIVRATGLDWTIFRPSLIHGPGAEFMEMVKGWVTGRSAPWFVLPYFARVDVDQALLKPFPPPMPQVPVVQPVAIEDVVRAMADALRTPATVGEVYALGGPEALSWPEMLTIARDAIPLAKKRIRPAGLPVPIAVGMARAASVLGFAAALPFTAEDAVLASQDNVCSLEKARADLGFVPRPFAEGIAAYGPTL